MNNLQILFKSNALIKASHELNVVDNRIMQLVFLNLQIENKKIFNNITTITKEDLKKVILNKTDRTNKDIKKLMDSLKTDKTKKIEINDTDIDQALERLSKNNIEVQLGKRRGVFNLISAWEYSADSEDILVEVPNLLLNFLRDYKATGYTPINITKYISIKSSNSQRIYELIRMWSGTKQYITFDVKELKEQLHLTNKYKEFSNFRIRVIEAAIKELKERELLDIYKVEYVKKGKTVEKIRFFVRDLEPRLYSLNLNKNTDCYNYTGMVKVDKSNVIENNSKKKTLLSENTINKFIKDYNQDLVSEALKILEKKQATKGVTAPKKFLEGVLKKLKERDLKQSITKIVEEEYKQESKFRNFTERKYDYDKLEKQLLGWDDGEYEDEE